MCNIRHSNKLEDKDARELTADEIRKLGYGKEIYLEAGCGCLVRCRVNGQVKTWRTRPNEYRVPMKFGLRGCFYLENGRKAYVAK